MARCRLQFSLSALFSVALLTACVAWWFRPGVVKPEFSLEKFARASAAHSGKDYVEAHFRLSNAGPDSICFDHSHYIWKFEGGDVDEGGWEDAGGGTTSWPSHPIRLKPGTSTELIVRLDGYVRTVQLGVEIADRRGQKKRQYRSQSFSVPENLFAPDSR